MITQTIAAMTLALILAVPGLAKAEYLFTSIDVPGATRTSANGNGTRSIVGDFDDPNGQTHGFVLSKGVFTQIDIDVPGAISTSVNGVNGKGQLVGFYIDAWVRSTGISGARASSPRSTRPVRSARAPSSSTRGARSSGQYRKADDVRHGFVWTNGVFTTIDVPGATATTVIGINDPGELVGTYVDAKGNRHGFLLSKKGVLHDPRRACRGRLHRGPGHQQRRRDRRTVCGCRRHEPWLHLEQRRLHDDRRARLEADRDLLDRRPRPSRGSFRGRRRRHPRRPWDASPLKCVSRRSVGACGLNNQRATGVCWWLRGRRLALVLQTTIAFTEWRLNCPSESTNGGV